MNIYQMLPNFSYGDAIGDDTLALNRILTNLGHQTGIFAGVIHPYLVDQAKHWKQYHRISNPENILIYHFSVGSEITDFLMKMPDRLILIFHNVTPAHWFFGVSPHMVELAAEGWEQLQKLREKTEIAWADSEYNAEVLRKIGYPKVHVLPIIIDFTRLDCEPNKLFTQQFQSTQTTWLFTGRVTPNKCHQDVIKPFAFYKKHINPHSRLFLVGDMRNCHRYAEAAVQMVRRMGISDVHFTGMIDDDELIALYRMSDVFVCMSEHEGFCVPVLEAMYFDLPVVAYAAGAVPWTLGDAGILVYKKDPASVAELIHQILCSETFRESILKEQRRRLKIYCETDYSAKVKDLLEGLLL